MARPLGIREMIARLLLSDLVSMPMHDVYLGPLGRDSAEVRVKEHPGDRVTVPLESRGLIDQGAIKRYEHPVVAHRGGDSPDHVGIARRGDVEVLDCARLDPSLSQGWSCSRDMFIQDESNPVARAHASAEAASTQATDSLISDALSPYSASRTSLPS